MINRGKRLRKTENLRSMCRETYLTKNDFVLPIFLVEGTKKKNPITSMPGVYQYSLDNALIYLEKLVKKGLRAVLLFGIPSEKDAKGSGCLKKESIVASACRAIKKEFPELLIITDICMCEYTSHGHCGILNEDGSINNDATLKTLAQQAVVHCENGADIVAPSAMADGAVKAIRMLLDQSELKEHAIMGYSAKYASCFYGPFRDAALSAPSFGHRKGYQMDMANQKEALKEIQWDIQEGVDIIMVKPALAYLDIIALAKNKVLLPIAAYQVSGEYASIKIAAEKNIFTEREAIFETVTAIKRAGANIIISYFTPEMLEWL